VSNLDTPNKEDKGASQIEHPLTDEELKRKIEEITQTMLIALSEWQAGSVVNYTSIKAKGRQELFDLIKSRENHLKEDLKVVGGEGEELREILRSLIESVNKWQMYVPSAEAEAEIHHVLQLIKSRDQRIALEAQQRTDELLDALSSMYEQYCGDKHGHMFMGAGEGASELLERYGRYKFDGAGRIIATLK